MNEIKIFTILFILVSCNPKSTNDLSVSVKNTSINVYCPNDDCNSYDIFIENKYSEKAKNILTIELTNNSEHTYVLTPNCLFGPEWGCNPINSSEAMNISNIQFVNEDGENARYGTSFHHSVNLQDSLAIDNFKKLDYQNSYNGNLIYFKKIQDKIMILPPKQTFVYETLIYLPHNKISKKTEGVVLSFNETYTARIVLNSDTTNISKYFTRDFIKTADLNNYKFYQGKLISNTVDVKFVN